MCSSWSLLCAAHWPWEDEDESHTVSTCHCRELLPDTLPTLRSAPTVYSLEPPFYSYPVIECMQDDQKQKQQLTLRLAEGSNLWPAAFHENRCSAENLQ